MYGSNNIRWRTSDEKELRRVVKNYNNRLNNNLKVDPDLKKYSPEKIVISDVLNNAKSGTRKDFNRLLNTLERYRGNDAKTLITNKYGVTITQYEKKEITYNIRSINAKRKAQLNKLLETNPAMIRENGQTMGDADIQMLKPKVFNFNNRHGGKEWIKFKESVQSQTKSNYFEDMQKLYKDKYLKAVKDFLGEDGNEVYNYVKDLDYKDIAYASFEDPILNIGFTSDPLSTDLIANETLKHWKQYINSLS